MWMFPCTCTLIKNPMMMMKSNMTDKDGKDVAHNIAFLTCLQVLNQLLDELNVLSSGHQIFD